MNEKIKGLLWKASLGYNDSWSQVDPEVLEKFAELIIQECAEIALREDHEPYDCILKHLGIEDE